MLLSSRLLSDLGLPLEQVLIDEFLAVRGQTRRSIQHLPKGEALELLNAAADYACRELATIASRLHWAHEINRPS